MKFLFPVLALCLVSCSQVDKQVSSDIKDQKFDRTIEADLSDDMSDSDIQKMSEEYHLSIRDNSPEVKNDGNVVLIDVPENMNIDEVLNKLSKDSRVEASEKVVMAHALFTPNDPDFNKQWHMKAVNAESAWDYSCGQGVTVAVVDTGVACYDNNGFHKVTDLKGVDCLPGHNFVSNNTLASDDQSHGTHVAGTIAQATNNGYGVAGLSHCAKILPVKVLGANGSGTMAGVADGIRWAADNGAQVINLSLGSSAPSPVVRNSVKYAKKHGVVVVAAAGNDQGPVGYPAAYPEAIAVSATDQKNNIAWFSSRGPEVAISAPGVDVLQQTICDSGRNNCEEFKALNGTSMATPHVAGVAALVVSQGVTDPDAVEKILQSSSKSPPVKDKNLYGEGILNAGGAMFHAHWLQLVGKLGLLSAILFLFSKKFGKSLTAPTVLTSVAVCVGVFPLLPIIGGHSLGWAGSLLSRPFPEWDMIYNAGLHKYLPLANFLPVFALTAIGFGNETMRKVIGGFALGMTAYLLHVMISGNVYFAFGTVAMYMFTLVNSAVCFWFANKSLASKN